MGVNLTAGAISKIVTGKCTENDLYKPVLQVINIACHLTRCKDGKQLYETGLSDGSFWQFGLIGEDIFISKKMQIGSIVQLTNFHLTDIHNIKDEIIDKRILIRDYNLLRSKCDSIGDPKLYPCNETPLFVRTAPPTSKQKQHGHVEAPPTSIQKPSISTQKCSSHSPTQNKNVKLQSTDDAISGFGKDISKLVSMTVEKTIEDGLGACYKKLGTLEEGVSKMTKLMMEKSKEVDAGFKKLETLEEEVFKLTKLMMEKNKEDVVGFKKLETLEEDVSKMAKMMMEKNKEDDMGACIEKLETLEEDVSKMAKMMTDKNKEDDMGACIEKLDKMGWGAEEPIYDTALLLFLKGADYRKLWLHLKPERCGKWVKIAGSIFGLLD